MVDHARETTLVIPARNAGRTLAECLASVVAIRDRPDSPLRRILLVDDGSTDDTVAIARAAGVEVVEGEGRGAGAARNLGIALATTPLVWFVDADCVARPDALSTLLPHLDDPAVAGVGGTYDIAPEASLLERLIHEEIKVRHDAMPAEVDFLATFDVLYRRAVLEEVGRFDERYLKGQDAELAFRVLEAGHRLRFERASAVRHHHADRLSRYLRVQRQQGYWRVALHLEHRGRSGNSYSGLVDHVQPFVAAAMVAAAPLVAWWPLGGLPFLVLAASLLLLQVPMTGRMIRRAGPSMAGFLPLGWIRSVWRAVGLGMGVIHRTLGRGGIGARRAPA